MRAEEADDFKKLMKRLCAVIGRRFDDALCDAYWSALRGVSLAHFSAKCGSLIEHATTDTKFPRPAYFRPAEAVVISTEPNDGFSGDRWDIASNHLLVAFIRRRLAANPHEWGAAKSARQMAAVASLVRHKRRWAALMRDWGVDENGELEIPPAADQNAAWKASMESAEAEIAALSQEAA